MDTTSIIILANEAGMNIPFYQWFYDGKLPFTSFDQIPIMTKGDTYDFEIANPEADNYFGDNPTALELSTRDLIVVQSSVTKRKIMYTRDDAILPIHYFMECKTVEDIVSNIVLVINVGYKHITWLSQLSGVIDGIDIECLVGQDAHEPSAIRDKLQSHRDAGKKIIFVGDDVWIHSLLCRTEGGSDEGDFPIKSVYDEDVLLFLPKVITPWNNSVLRDAVNEKVIVFTAVEPGTKGMFRIGVCDAYADDEQTIPIYHLYRPDLYDEVVDGINCITCDRQFPLIRCSSNDYVEIVDVDCACGFQGKGLIFKFREDDPEGILYQHSIINNL